MVIEGKEGVKLMGEWEKGELIKEGKKKGEDLV